MRLSTLFNRTNIIHKTTSVSQRLNILCIMFKIITFFVESAGKHDLIVSLKREFWSHYPSLTPPLFIEVYVPSQKSDWWFIFVLEVSILPLSTILVFDFRIFLNLTVWYFFVCRFILIKYPRTIFILTEKFGSRIFFFKK